MTTPFEPAAPGVHFRRNAVLSTDEDELRIAMGFGSAGRALVEHWQVRGPDDGLFLPIVYLYRHALELVLKAAIREAAARRRADGHTEKELSPSVVDSWLASSRGAGHSLELLSQRLDADLGALHLENLPPDTHDILRTLHELDPRGDTFRYATTRDAVTRTFVPAPRPNATLVDVVAMAEHFDSAFNLLVLGVMSVLDQYHECQIATGL